jgi:DNA-directed RNA polymerase subunit RPC12/RpoP
LSAAIVWSGDSAMTTQTKKFIEPQDITALCFECSNCKACLSLSLSEKINIQQLAVCPHCQRPWLRLPIGQTIELDLLGLIEKFKVLGTHLGKAPYDGFSLRLEITKEPED